MSEQKDHKGYGTIYQDTPGVDKWDGTIPVLGPDGEYFEAYLDVWEDRAPANGGKHTRNVRVRTKNWKNLNVPAGGRAVRETAAPVGTPPPRLGREPGPPPAYQATPHPGAVKPSAMPYGDDSYDSWAAQDYAQNQTHNPYDYRDNPQRVGGPDE